MFNTFLARVKYFKPHSICFRTVVTKELECSITEPCTTRLLKVAIIGMPNAGKSTFINTLMDRKVCPASAKVHTTKKTSYAIFTEEDVQIVFLDTPGIISVQEYKKYNLQRSFLKDGPSSLQSADVIGVIHDSTAVRSMLDMKIIKMLESHKKKPSFLVLNKVDLLKSKRKLLDLARLLTESRIAGQPFGKLIYKNEEIEHEEDNDSKAVKEGKIHGWPHFSEIFMVSSLTGDGMDKLKDYFVDSAKPAPWMFPAESFSNEKFENIIVGSVRAKLLDFLPQEIPYVVETNMELFEFDSGDIRTVVIITCPNPRIARLVAGDGEGKLKQILAGVKNDLQNTFRCFVKIKLVVVAKK